MKILLVIPTRVELELIQQFFPQKTKPLRNEVVQIYGHQVQTLVSGAGLVNTSVQTTLSLSRNEFNFAIQAGIAGSFSEDLTPGQVVEVISDFLPEFGAEDEERFIPFHQLGISMLDQLPQPADGILRNSGEIGLAIRKVAGVTVNRVTGSEESRDKLLRNYAAEVETMESYAFFFSCIFSGIPFVCLRGISNRVGKRDRSTWKIQEATSNLANQLDALLRYLTSPF